VLGASLGEPFSLLLSSWELHGGRGAADVSQGRVAGVAELGPSVGQKQLVWMLCLCQPGGEENAAAFSNKAVTSRVPLWTDFPAGSS
jgi:hypothetical protein